MSGKFLKSIFFQNKSTPGKHEKRKAQENHEKHFCKNLRKRGVMALVQLFSKKTRINYGEFLNAN